MSATLKRLRLMAIAVMAVTGVAGRSSGQTCTTYPNTLTNGTTADATQVMGNFNCAALLGGANFTGGVNVAGNVGIGTTAPTQILDISIPDGAITTQRIRIADMATTSGQSGGYPAVEVIGARADGNTTFEGRLAASYRRADGTPIGSGATLGAVLFGGQYGTDTTFQLAKLLYPASIQGVAEGNFTASGAMPTGIAFMTGSTGNDVGAVNVTYGAERMRISSAGNVGIGTTAPGAPLQVNSGVAKATTANTDVLTLSSNDVNSSALQLLFELNSNSTASSNYTTIQSIEQNVAYRNLAINPFGGSVGIGTATPAYLLHVNGTAYATGAAGALSDIRHKDKIQPLPAGAIDLIERLRPVSFVWKKPTDDGMKGPQIGFIAQEVEKVIPSVVLTEQNAEKTKDLKYTELIPVLTKAIQEQEEEIKSQRAEIEQLKHQLAELRGKPNGG